MHQSSGENGGQKAAKKKREYVSYKTLFRIYKLFGRYYKKYWKNFAIAYLGLLASTALGLLAPWPIKLILDNVILNHPLPENVHFIYRYVPDEPYSLLLIFAVAYFVINVTRSFISFLYKIGISIVGSKMVAEFRERLFAHLQQLSLSFHGKSSSGDIVYRMTNDIAQVKKLLIQVPQQLAQRSLVLVAYIGMMLALNWRLALIAFSIIPVIYLFNRVFGAGVQSATREKRSKESEVTSIIFENVTAMALVQAYGREDLQQARFQAENQQSVESSVKALQLSKLNRRVNNILISVGTAGVLYFGGSLALNDALLPGTIVLFVSYLKKLYGPLDKFAVMLLQIASSQVACDRLLEIIECNLVIEDAPDARPAPPLKGKIVFDRVSFSYPGTGEVLKNISFAIQPGEKIALVGHSGAGKSTLLSLLMRFYDPQSGRILFDDEDLRKFTLQSVRGQITILMQEARLLNQTVSENIAFGKPGASREEIKRAARRAQAHSFIKKMPQGYDSIISEGGANLSGGQLQRINIARAMIRDTPIIILDEPATALDARTEKKLNKAISELTRGKTSIIVAHKFSTIANADKILLLDGGELAGFGTHDELVAQNPIYRSMYELQMPQQPEQARRATATG